jgi:hypothetical protein
MCWIKIDGSVYFLQQQWLIQITMSQQNIYYFIKLYRHLVQIKVYLLKPEIFFSSDILHIGSLSFNLISSNPGCFSKKWFRRTKIWFKF